MGTVLEDDLGEVLETDVAKGAVATDDSDLGQLADLLVGHVRLRQVGEIQ